jgi:meso-butanediol dehydrogenase/(S,S)-butanediol dehydrogenase/diacetyl reductase
MDPQRLAGKNILITGAARGMGATNAEYFAQQGANVCLGDLDIDLANKMAETINARGNGKAIAVQMDVTISACSTQVLISQGFLWILMKTIGI